MTQIADHPAYLQLEDRIDVIGQKYRVQRIVRGLLLWLVFAAVATAVAAGAAHFAGAGTATRFVVWGWIAWLLGSAAFWFVRPMLIRPDPVEVARFVEARVEGLHNGLTNGLLLARRNDIANNAWLPEIFEEIGHSTDPRTLSTAVKFRDLRPLALGSLGLLVLVAIAGVLFRTQMAHGWDQMFNPTAFVPQFGSATITAVQPGDTQVISGRPLDVTILAEAPSSAGQPKAKVIFDEPAGSPAGAGASARPKDAEILPASVTDAADRPGWVSLRYTYHIAHLDRSAAYRVEVGGTQSRWFAATVLRQVTLEGLSLRIASPAYTRIEPRTLQIKAEVLAKTPVVVAQGSRIELEAAIDVPIEGAMIQAGDGAAPAPMTKAAQGRRFSAAFTVVRDTPVAILLTDASGQTLFRVPTDRFVIGCTPDAPPVIEMRWPTQDLTVPPDTELKIAATLRDDYGVASARILVSPDNPTPLAKAKAQAEAGDDVPAMKEAFHADFPAGTTAAPLAFTIPVNPAFRKHDNVLRIQVETTDNRDLGPAALQLLTADRPAGDKTSDDAAGPQTTRSTIYQIRFQDPEQITKHEKQQADELRRLLQQLLEQQRTLHAQLLLAKLGDKDPLGRINAGQVELRTAMKKVADTFKFESDDRIIQKTLQMLALEPAREAVELSSVIQSEPSPKQWRRLSEDLQTRQRRIITTLESLLTTLKPVSEATTRPTTRAGGDLVNRAEEMKKLDEALKEFMKQQQRILDQTAPLAKKPVDDFSDADKKTLDDLKMAQEKLDAFMQEKVHDFSKLAEQDMANASTLKELFEVYSEVTMAKDALKQKAAEIAVAAEENGIDKAKEIESNLEKWLSNAPDRVKWTQEDLPAKSDIPMAELPKELEDMVGKLLEQEEDLFDEMEDANANLTGSFDKGVGWDAADGPIASMTAKGVTGNQLPNNNEMGGRSGEGRSGKSQGEFVEDTATGKGGRRTPTRLDPTAFQQGRVKDESKDATGGATGGGKVSGQGGAGLEGPVPAKQKEQMQRLAQKQAELRNAAERLNLQYQLGRYDNFKLTQGTALMRRVEADLDANHYQNALRRRDVLLDSMDTSRLLLGAEVHVKQDTTPTSTSKTRQDLNDAMKGELPPAWSDSLKKYYERLGQE